MPSRLRTTALLALTACAASCGGDQTPGDPSPGRIRVAVVTTGASLDDGYTITLDANVVATIAANASTMIPGVSPGKHAVALSDVAANCAVSVGSTTVTLSANAESQVDFAVACTQVVGSLTVSTSTVGSDIDPSGYVVTVEGMPPRSIGANATITIPDVAAGTRSVALVDVAENCVVTDAAVRSVSVTGGAITPTFFFVTCYQGRIAFWSNRANGNNDIYTMNPDGTAIARLTTSPAFDEQPAWSPDGRRIAFTSSRSGSDDIHVMQEDGSGVQRLTTNGARDELPSWSPDGTKIVFTSNRDGNNEIYVMNADGTNQRNLTNSPFNDTEARFSPDGRRIVFVSDRDGDVGDIYTMDTSGTNVLRLTTSPLYDGRPSYSPDGSRILFYSSRDDPNPPATCCYPEIYVMNADGSNQVRLTNDTFSDAFPQFSPDQSRIVFATARDDNWEIYTMTASGGSLANVTKSLWVEKEPVWRPTHTSAGAVPVRAARP